MILCVVEKSPVGFLIFMLQHLTSSWVFWVSIGLWVLGQYLGNIAAKYKAKKISDLECDLAFVSGQIEGLVSDTVSNNKIILTSDIEDSVIVCGNGGHRHRYKSFEYAFGNTMDFTLEATSVASRISSRGTTTVDGKVIGRTESEGQAYAPQFTHNGSSKIVTKRGCPTCKSDLFEFERAYLQNYTFCTSGGLLVPSHWRLKSGPCPVCTSSLLTRRSVLTSQLAELKESK